MSESYIELTNKCNQDCLFCIRPRHSSFSMSTSEAKGVINRMKNNDMIVFTGGEPTIRKDLPELVEYAKKEGINRIEIQSNGVLLKNKDFVKALKEAGLDKANIALHSANPEVMNMLTRTKTFYSTIEGITNLHKLNIEVEYAFIINSLNYTDIKKTVEFVFEKYGKVSLFSFIFVRPEESGWENSNIIPRYTDIKAYLHESMQYCSENNIPFNVEYVPFCFLGEFMENSVDYKRILQKTKMVNYWKEEGKRKEDTSFIKNFQSMGPQCKFCKFYHICPGVRKNYAKLYGTYELFPIFE
ncbi:MAG: radical SAM protein [Candidatus Nanoarchaeia archaeon]